MPLIIYRSLGIPQIRQKWMTFLFPESVLTFTKLQPQEKLFNLQNSCDKNTKSFRVSPILHSL